MTVTLGFSSIQSGSVREAPDRVADLGPVGLDEPSGAELRRVDPRLGREQALRELEMAHLEREEEHGPLRFERCVRCHAEREGGVVNEHVGRDEVVGDRDRQVVDLMHPDELDLEDLVPQSQSTARPAASGARSSTWPSGRRPWLAARPRSRRPPSATLPVRRLRGRCPLPPRLDSTSNVRS